MQEIVFCNLDRIDDTGKTELRSNSKKILMAAPLCCSLITGLECSLKTANSQRERTKFLNG